jgi:hypothetical protein
MIGAGAASAATQHHQIFPWIALSVKNKWGTVIFREQVGNHFPLTASAFRSAPQKQTER